jgi:RNA polymerase subunit RPABC4/transcription elongation factor Spt4/Arc/MetJ-type ribon-helix-helix transcriptional regulator
MSKITFRADDDLVERVEELDASKSEVMREALRAHLNGPERANIDALIADRVDELVEARLDEFGADGRDVNVNLTVESADTAQADRGSRERSRPRDRGGRERLCDQCGEAVSDGHEYCPNCGERAASTARCECGEELRADWAHCPACGRRTPSADVLGE